MSCVSTVENPPMAWSPDPRHRLQQWHSGCAGRDPRNCPLFFWRPQLVSVVVLDVAHLKSASIDRDGGILITVSVFDVAHLNSANSHRMAGVLVTIRKLSLFFDVALNPKPTSHRDGTCPPPSAPQG